jgi:membrane-bound lytic murein transglycosylase B
MEFSDWRNAYIEKAVKAGLSRDLVNRELADVTPTEAVVSRDSSQPEFSKPISIYIANAISDGRVNKGRLSLASMAFLPAMESRYGVPAEITLAVWAMESDFGRLQGDHDVVRAFASLAWDGRRRGWAEDELTAALKIIASGEAPRSRLTGSWAGAMGQTQFLPSVFLSRAIDADGDGKRDIWGSTQDAVVSTANYLSREGWRRGESWTVEVSLPSGFDYSLSETEARSPSDWMALGVTRADGQPWSSPDMASKAQLLLPTGAQGPALLAFPNHFSIRKYNNSTAYALSVGFLAQRFAGSNGLATPWPVEVPLALADRKAAQKALALAGFSPGPADGAIGSGTRSALKAWQKARNLVADGYLSPDMISKLKAESGL